MLRIISGTYKNRKLFAPKGAETRPTKGVLREALFNICQSYIEGARFLDLFAGSGAMGIEALSRGASTATFIDSQRAAIQCIRENLTALQLTERTRILQGDIFAMLDRLIKENALFDVIYVDPPYGSEVGQSILEKIDRSSLLAPSGMLFIEDASESMPQPKELVKLSFVGSRRLGKSGLQQYHYA